MPLAQARSGGESVDRAVLAARCKMLFIENAAVAAKTPRIVITIRSSIVNADVLAMVGLGARDPGDLRLDMTSALSVE